MLKEEERAAGSDCLVVVRPAAAAPLAKRRASARVLTLRSLFFLEEREPAREAAHRISKVKGQPCLEDGTWNCGLGTCHKISRRLRKRCDRSDSDREVVKIKIKNSRAVEELEAVLCKRLMSQKKRLSSGGSDECL